MLQRLAVLVGSVVVWLGCALALPLVFWGVSGLIAVLTVVHVVRAKQFAGGAVFFTGVAVATALIATAGFFMQRTVASEGTAEKTVAVADAAATAEQDEEPAPPATGAASAAAATKAGDEAPPAAVDPDTAVKDALAAVKKSCKSLAAVASAWRSLAAVPADAKAYARAKKATVALEKCRKQGVAASTKDAEKARSKERQALVKEVGKVLASQGLKAQPSLAGKTKNALVVKGPKLTAEQIEQAFAGGAAADGTLLGRLQAAGFVKVTVAAGKASRSFALQPAADAAALTAELVRLGLAEPLRLP